MSDDLIDRLNAARVGRHADAARGRTGCCTMPRRRSSG